MRRHNDTAVRLVVTSAVFHCGGHIDGLRLRSPQRHSGISSIASEQFNVTFPIVTNVFSL